jgi:molybdate transport system substrate-binding protein
MSSLAARELKVLSTLAVQGAMPALATGYESLAGARLEVEFAPTIGLMARIDAGERADVAILTREVALLSAKSIAYSRIGASGILFARMVEQLGIAEEVNAKATIIPSGLTAELVARGQAELAVQQVSELMVVPGVDIVGPLPAPLQSPAMFSAGVFADCAEPDGAERILQFLTSAAAAPMLQAAGLEPVLRSRR